RPDLAKLPGAGKYKRGSNVRVPGKRHLARRCEDAHLACVPHLRWENERALGEVEFPRNLLHLLLREAVSLGEDSQRISAKSCLCQAVECKFLVLHRRSLVTPPCQSPMEMQIRPAPPRQSERTLHGQGDRYLRGYGLAQRWRSSAAAYWPHRRLGGMARP